MPGTRALAMGLGKGALTIAALLLSSSLAHADIFFRNLFANPGAEEGPASPDGNTVVPVPGWTTSGNFTVVRYGTPGSFPAPGDPGPPDRGVNLFVGGPDNPSSGASQVIDVPPEDQPYIDYGIVFFEARAYLGGFLDEEDHAGVDIAYKNAQGDVLARAVLGPVTAGQRGNRTGLVLRGGGGWVPPGARRIEMGLTMTRVAGSYNNAFADGMFLWLIVGDAVEPATWGGIKALFENGEAPLP